MVIKDTGAGMSPERIKQIFEPFNTTKSRGLGLGMPYAQKDNPATWRTNQV